MDDKHQITAMFEATLADKFLPVQVIYEGKAYRCLPNFELPNSSIVCEVIRAILSHFIFFFFDKKTLNAQKRKSNQNQLTKQN